MYRDGDIAAPGSAHLHRRAPTGTGAPETLRSTLRERTASLHDRLEQMWTCEGSFASLAVYSGFLQRLLHAHATLGLAAAAARGDGVEIAVEEQRIAALCDDLGIDEVPAETPWRPNLAYAWGVGYVLNGSTLGASIILKQNYIEADWPRRYMMLGNAYASDGSARAFFDALNIQPLDTDDVVRGALNTFSLLEAPKPERAPPEGARSNQSERASSRAGLPTRCDRSC